jgi:hypothetical protein
VPIIRTYARQGHAVPKGYQRPLGPFPPEVLAQSRVVYDTDHGDSLHEALDDVRYFRCKECHEVLADYELNEHECEEEE